MSIRSSIALLLIVGVAGCNQAKQDQTPKGGGGKPAKLETGAVVRVPLFVGQDEVIKVDTRTGEYVSRVK